MSAEPLSFAARASNLNKEQQMPKGMTPRPVAPRPVAAAAPTANGKAPHAANGPSSSSHPPSAPKAAAAAVRPSSASSSSSSSAASSSLTSPHATKVIKAPRLGFGMVKGVPSGDSLILKGNSIPDAPDQAEKNIVLNSIIAPRFAKGKTQVDEPYAWEAREYLRKRVIGKRVEFDILYTDEASKREWANVTFNGVNLALDLVSHGWAKVKTSTTKDGKERAGPEELTAAQEEAKAQGRGLWNSTTDDRHHVRTLNWSPDPRAFFEASRGKAISAVVDGVRDGSTLRLELLNGSDPLSHTVILLHLAGVQCARTPMPLSVLQQQHDQRTKDGKNREASSRPEAQEEAEPFALEAQQYVEDRLLHRNVTVTLLGVDKSGNFFGSVGFSLGNISLKLLEKGLGKVVPWSAALTTNAEELKSAEHQARQAQLGVWSDASASSASSSSDDAHENGVATAISTTPWEGKVVSILSGDTITVADGDGEERRVSLASIRAGRLGRRGAGPAASTGEEPFAAEAKEHLRSKLIGHRVKVIPEYSRAGRAGEKNEAPRLFATVFQGKHNINESIVSAGLAEVIRHRLNEERSQFYELYLSAEHQAEEAQRGRFNKKQAASSTAKLVDLTDKPRAPRRPAASSADEGADDEDGVEKVLDPKEEERQSKAKALSAKAKTYLSFLSRDKNVQAVVDYVFTGSRYKLLIPKENLLISFALGGVRTPSASARSGASADAAGPEAQIAAAALSFVRARILQHSVRIEVEALDKGDNFLGSLFVGKANLAVDLLREGLASLVDFSAKRSPYAKELFAAEAEAKAAKKGLWVNYEPPAEGAEKPAAFDGAESSEEAAPISDDTFPVKVTEIEDANDFWLHFLTDDAAANLEAKLRAFGENARAQDVEFHPTPQQAHGGIVAGLFSDGAWYRVKLEGATEHRRLSRVLL